MIIWEQTATCATYSINWLVFITQVNSIYSAVRTGSLNKAVCASSLSAKGFVCLIFQKSTNRSRKAHICPVRHLIPKEETCCYFKFPWLRQFFNLTIIVISRWWLCSVAGTKRDRGKHNIRREACPSGKVSTKNPIPTAFQLNFTSKSISYHTKREVRRKWHKWLFSDKHLKTKRRLLYLKTQSVPRCKHFSSQL